MTEQEPVQDLDKALQAAFAQYPKEKWGELFQAIEAQGDDESKLLFCLLVIGGGK